MSKTTAEKASEALKLALEIVERRRDKAVTADPRIWRTLIAFAPRWVVLSAAFKLREQRRIERRITRRRERLRALKE